MNPQDTDLAKCTAGLTRRTIWDGAQELVEIQMPLGPVWEENDTAPVTLQHTDGADQNPYYGRVLYTPGLQVDQPVAVTRVGYHDQPVSNTTPTAWPSFTLSLFWNSRGQAALGAFSDGAAVRQLTPGMGPCSTGSDAQRCVRVFWPTNWAAYDPRPGQTVFSWHGSLLEDKMDKVGTGFRRNRHYDPQTGRFTQEDPIGLAGGVNLYGFANGDPVNFSDPFGLCPECQEGDNGQRRREGLGNRLLFGSREACSADNNADCSPSFVELGVPLLTPGGAFAAGSALGRLLGRPFPTKIGAGGRLQPFNPATGRFLGPSVNPGLRGLTGTQFIVGLGQGFGTSASGVEAPVAATKAQQLGQTIGRLLNALSNLFP